MKSNVEGTMLVYLILLHVVVRNEKLTGNCLCCCCFVTGKTGKENILFNFFNDFLRVGQKIV